MSTVVPARPPATSDTRKGVSRSDLDDDIGTERIGRLAESAEDELMRAKLDDIENMSLVIGEM